MMKLVVDAAHAGKRLDVFLADMVVDMTRSQAKQLILQKHVQPQAKPSQPVEEGEVFEVSLPLPEPSEMQAEPIPLAILYEDADLIVINKPAGMVVHPAAGNRHGTLVNALLHHCSDLSGVGGELKPGIVHRLDQGTSGVMVAAKNDRTHLALAKQFEARTVEKIYLAFVYGSLQDEQGHFDAPIGRSIRDRKKMSSRTRKGRAALTEWRIVEHYGKAITQVEVRLQTGRTHQIRVHFAEGGHPLIGDTAYGGERQPNRLPKGRFRSFVETFSRPALHALRLSFLHPKSGEKFSVTAPLPEDLQELRKWCEVL